MKIHIAAIVLLSGSGAEANLEKNLEAISFNKNWTDNFIRTLLEYCFP